MHTVMCEARLPPGTALCREWMTETIAGRSTQTKDLATGKRDPAISARMDAIIDLWWVGSIQCRNTRSMRP